MTSRQESAAIPHNPAREPVASNELDLISHSVEQTRRIGARLATLLRPGDVLLLEGQLGAGKTAFTQGVAAGLNIRDYVNSPTFVLVNEYPGDLPLNHIDLYRLDDPRQAIDIGIEDYIGGDGITVIEWPERGGEFMPDERLHIRLTYLSETKRTIRFTATGRRYVALLTQFKQEAFA